MPNLGTSTTTPSLTSLIPRILQLVQFESDNKQKEMEEWVDS